MFVSAALIASTLLVAILPVADATAQSLVISEFMAMNDDILADEDGEYSDWVEVYNAGADAVSLAGWALTDDESESEKWTFPELELPAGGFLVVFASGKDRRDPDAELHTSFRLSGAGEYLALVEPGGVRTVSEYRPEYPAQVAYASYGRPMTTTRFAFATEGEAVRYFVPTDDSLGDAWRDLEFDDAGWASGPTPIGFDQKSTTTFAEIVATDVAEVFRGVNPGIFLRKRFTFSGARPDELDVLLLRARYEDGFAAYLNGELVASAEVPEDLDWSSRADSSRQAGRETEIVLFDITSSLAHLREGENVLAIHALNRSVSNSDFLISVDLEGVRVDGIETTTRRFFDQPSPGLPNGEGSERIAESPTFSRPTGVSVEDVILELSTATPGGQIRYTTDGSKPEPHSPLYSGTITLDRTLVVRARTFAPGYVRSPVSTESYVRLADDVVRFSSDLPIFVINTFGGAITPTVFRDAHVYVTDVGEDGRATLTDGVDFAGPGALKVRGSSTEGRPKKAFNLELRDDRGDDRAASLLGLPADADWVLYAPYNFDRALMRNPFVYEVSNQVGRYATRTRFCEVFVNTSGGPVRYANYVGLYVLIEKITRGEHRVDVEKLEPFHNSRPEITGGYMLKIDRPDPGDIGFNAGGESIKYVDPKEEDVTTEQRQYISSFVAQMARSTSFPDAHDALNGYHAFLDEQSWIDHHLINEFTKNPDALRLSTYFFKPRGGVMEYGPVWDFDRTLGPDDDARAASPIGWMGPHASGWWGALLRRPDFSSAYSERWIDLREGAFATENLLSIIDSMAAELAEAQVRNYERWRGLVNPNGGWENEVRSLKNWVTQRVAWMDSELLLPPEFSHPGGPVSAGFTVSLLTPKGDIYYTIDGSDPANRGDIAATARLYDGPIPIEGTMAITARTRFGETWSRPVDEVYATGVPRLVVTEVNYDPPKDAETDFSGADREFIELQNVGDVPIDLTDWELGPRPSFDFNESAVKTLAPGEFLVIVNDLEGFVSRYGDEGIQIAGEYTRSLGSSVQPIGVIDANGSPVVQFSYDGNWYPEAKKDGGHSIVIRDARAAPETWIHGESWRASAAVFGSPGAEDPDPTPGGQIPGDHNQDGRFNIADAIGLLGYLFEGTEAPCATEDAVTALLDVNGDARVNIADAIFSLSYLFVDGEPPVFGIDCRPIAGCGTVCVDG